MPNTKSTLQITPGKFNLTKKNDMTSLKVIDLG